MTEGALQVVTFGIGSEIFAVPVAIVREILDHQAPFRLPNAPDYFVGLIDAARVLTSEDAALLADAAAFEVSAAT